MIAAALVIHYISLVSGPAPPAKLLWSPAAYYWDGLCALEAKHVPRYGRRRPAIHDFADAV